MLAALGQLAGTVASSLFSSSQANKQAKLQKQFAQQGVQWRVADAKKAGVHPLYALGANTQSYSPVHVGTPDFSSTGQALGDAVHKSMDHTERASARLALDNAALQNEYLRAQIASVRSRLTQSPAVGGARYIIDGQGDGAAPLVTKITPPEYTTHVNTPLGRIMTRPGTSNAQTWEDRYGDVIQELGGAGNFISDMLYTGNQQIERNWPQFYEWFRRNYVRQ